MNVDIFVNCNEIIQENLKRYIFSSVIEWQLILEQKTASSQS